MRDTEIRDPCVVALTQALKTSRVQHLDLKQNVINPTLYDKAKEQAKKNQAQVKKEENP